MRTSLTGGWALVLWGAVLVLASGCGGAQPQGASSPVGGSPALDFVPVPGGTEIDTPSADGGGGRTLEGGVLATFVVGGVRVRVWTAAEPAAGLLQWISQGVRPFIAIAGPIASGPGVAEHNAPWSWHMAPEQVYVNLPTPAESRYLGSPSQIEADRVQIMQDGRHIVLSSSTARLVGFEDFRAPRPDPPQR